MTSLSAAIVCLIVCCLPSVGGQACQNEWTYFDGSCYMLGTETLTWADAEQMCRIVGSDLVVVETAFENAFLKRYLSEHHVTTQSRSSQVWIGATDVFSEGQFLWINIFKNVTFADWARGEPNSYFGPGSEDCVQVGRQNHWQWNDQACSALSFFVCEMKALGGGIIG